MTEIGGEERGAGEEPGSIRPHGGWKWRRLTTALGFTVALLVCLALVARWRADPFHIVGEHSGGVRSLAFSPDGTILYSASSREIKVWDLATNTQRGRFPCGGV